jgi:hypothetical protein
VIVQEEIARLQAKYSADFKDGARLGLGLKPAGPREPGDYPKGFHPWPLERRNAWFAGFNRGYATWKNKKGPR